MGRYQEFILTLLKDIMTPGYWYSIDEISGGLLDLRTKSSKKYMQLPSKHSLAQQMCRFFKNDILVKKMGNRNVYAILTHDEIDLEEIAKINTALDLDMNLQPHDWAEISPEAFELWVEYCTPNDDDDEFEVWV